MMVDGGPPGGLETYTRPEIAEVLGRASLDAASQAEVLSQLDRYTDDRRADRQEEEFIGGIERLAVVYERAAGEGASDSNIAGWYEELETQSVNVLRGFAARDEISEVEHSARNLAALLYVALARQARREPYAALLQEAGIGEGELMAQCRAALTDTAIEQGADRADAARLVRERYPTLRSMHANIVPHLWTRLISPMAAELRADLQAAGYELPELDEQGLYPDENEDD